ncbi:MAG: LOG family protein [Anaerolineae bacterium]
MPIISVYGSSAPAPDSADYEQARALGRLLAEAGFTVQTGGYGGVMEGASRGASEAGGHVIGVTCAQIETFRPLPPNRWVAEEIKYNTLNRRVMHLVKQCDGAIVMPGGIGTLSELALSWSLAQVGDISPRPIIAVGAVWARTLNAFITPDYIRPEHAALIQPAKTPTEALALLTARLAR